MTPVSAFDLFNGERPELSFGCEKIDRVIGMLNVAGITEISGEAGTGKTQFCLCLSLQCQLPVSKGGMNGSCTYLNCGEGQFPIRRLNQLAGSYSPDITQQTKFLENVMIEQSYSPEEALNTLSKKIPEMCLSKGVKLLIIDSLAGAYPLASSSVYDFVIT